MNNKKFYKNPVVFIMVCFFILVLSTSFTYAYFTITTSGEGNDIIISTQSLSILFTDTQVISGVNVKPGYHATKTFTVQNNGTGVATFNIYYDYVVNDFVDKTDLTYNLICSPDCESVYNVEFPSEGNDMLILSDIDINPGDTYTFNYALDFLSLDKDQNENQGKDISAKLKIAETITRVDVAGIVENNNTPVENATVKLGEEETTTESDGSYNIPDVVQGTYSLVVEKDSETLVDEVVSINRNTESSIEGNSINLTKVKNRPVFLMMNVASSSPLSVVSGVPDDLIDVITTLDNVVHSDNESSTYAPSGINYNNISSLTNGQGLYSISDNTYTEGSNITYFFRGGDFCTNTTYTTKSTCLSNGYMWYELGNNVLFAGKCWQIIRTTDSGGIKLLYNGNATGDNLDQCNVDSRYRSLPTTGRYHVNYNDNAYLGYMNGTVGASTYAETHSNSTDSDIKSKIDAWYLANLGANATKNYTSYLENAIYCNDRQPSSVKTSINGNNGYAFTETYYAPLVRLLQKMHPTLKCAQTNDQYTLSVSSGGTGGFGNNKLTYPIALITSDEAIYAGLRGSGTDNRLNYLYTKYGYWTLSPSHSKFATYPILIEGESNKGILNNYYYTYFNNNIKPVITLKSGVKYLSGNGTSDSPYTIVTSN